ncbi:alpha,alpha-trehalose-phosphate synthase (UDP-forming) [Halogeometricum luteum]|uniref:Trehalose-6-phosphate synthase n=1 Tax=Halogeometricum luteum TaxID=2950537 RepID=A0ABU2G7D2_9EURY|nr:trehalose-6-phosphate synthase [Halogeometricum sp. S3BR5-2]MDS0296188.1 trehalose-6-phosphate synthase [Halogeometricum sp. S3BR5-2]
MAKTPPAESADDIRLETGDRIEPNGRADADETAESRHLVVVSNREPYQHHYEDDGSIDVEEPVGGLTAGLDPVVQKTRGDWVAWGDGDADAVVTDDEDCVAVPPGDERYTLRRVWLTDDEVSGYYYGYSNRVLWPLCHDLVDRIEMEPAYWDTYKSVNESFGRAAAERATEDSTVWIQDYHFCLAPKTIRERLPTGANMVQFWHIPWPAWDTFRVVPNPEELIEGLLANDVVGFHVERYRDNFLECAAQLDRTDVDREAGVVRIDGREVRVGAFPMGVDAERIESIADGFGRDDWADLAERYGIDPDTRVAVGVDRIDYTKGIPHRIDALETFWETHPEWRGELTFVQKSSHSRSQIPAYQEIAEDVCEAVQRVNERFGTDEWTPIVHVDDYLSQRELFGLYRHSDVALVSPLRDGMNLVAKEYAAAQVEEDGVLLLSEFAGAHEQMTEAIPINPYSPDGFAESIHDALTMPAGERRRRMRALRDHVREDDLDAWVADLLESAGLTATETLLAGGHDV